MPSFGQQSMSRLVTVERDLQTVMFEVVKVYDISIISGHRTPEEQMQLWEKGRDNRGKIINASEVVTFKDGYKKKSKHNYSPSRAVDIAPYPSLYSDVTEFYYMAGVVMHIAEQLLADGRIENMITWGGRWENFKDLPHFQI